MCNTSSAHLLEAGKVGIRLFLGLILAFTLAPVSSLPSDEAYAAAAWAEDMPSMLEEGEYAEGEVVACVEDVGALSRTNGGTELETVFDFDVEEGIVGTSVKSAQNGTSHRALFANQSYSVYEGLHSLPQAQGDAYECDDFIDSEMGGILQPLQGYIYSLPNFKPVEDSPFVQSMWRYDIEADEWEKSVPLPEPLMNASAALWDGLLLVKGTSMEQLRDGAAQAWEDPSNAQAKVYSFDPSNGQWPAFQP